MDDDFSDGIFDKLNGVQGIGSSLFACFLGERESDWCNGDTKEAEEVEEFSSRELLV